MLNGLEIRFLKIALMSRTSGGKKRMQSVVHAMATDRAAFNADTIAVDLLIFSRKTNLQKQKALVTSLMLALAELPP